MDKTIENQFFNAFKWGGVVDKCIDWMRFNYNLPPMWPGENRKKEEELPQVWEKYYRETLPKEIQEATEAFDDSVIIYMDSPLIDEIEANLNECKTDEQKERYLFSLLKPFGEHPSGCGIASIYNPIAEINRLNESIKGLEKSRTRWQVYGEDAQVEACNRMIERDKKQIEWVEYVNIQFHDLTCKCYDGAKWMENGTVESCLSAFVNIMVQFANRLDALLLMYGIDLLKLQRESGLYIKDRRLITDIADYMESIELAQKYINALPKEPQQSQQPQQTLAVGKPQQDLEYFCKKAVNYGYLEKDGNTYKRKVWSKAQLAYFLNHFLEKGRFPESKYDIMFNESRLGKAYSQTINNKNGNGKPKGYEDIDELLEKSSK